MPGNRASKALRVRGLDPTLSVAEFQEIADRLSCDANPSKRSLLSSRRSAIPQAPKCSLASQDDCLTGVVTFASSETKNKAIKKAKDIVPEWQIDDDFDGLTILRTPDAIDVEYVVFSTCFVLDHVISIIRNKQD